AAVDAYIESISHGEKYNISIGNFAVFTDEEIKISDTLVKAIKNDLLFSRLFDIIDPKKQVYGKQPEFIFWKKLGTQILVSGSVMTHSGGDLFFTGKVFDIETEEQLFSEVYQGKTDNPKVLAHRFVDDIVFRFTGEQGVAQTKIVFVNNQTGKKELWMMDYDGDNVQKLTSDNSVVTMPRWSYDGKKVYYTSYKSGNPDIFEMDINNRKARSVVQQQGLCIMGAQSFDGQKYTVVLSKDGNPEIYVLDNEYNITKRLTWNRAVDVSPSFSPNNRDVVFTSGRSGVPQLYVTDTDGIMLRRLSYGGYCDSPAWSPRGRLIAYAAQVAKAFQITVVEPDVSNSFPEQLTTAGSNENPSWSPNAQWIVFSSNRSGRYELYRITVDGQVQQRVANIKGDSTLPCWSPCVIK
ncbi:MAG: hypothetical protein WC955_06640, partial [Elusimicrobiota bacterium]